MFKCIEEFQGLYEVSTEGVIRSVARNVINKNGKYQYYPSKVLKPDLAKTGHGRVTLSKGHARYRSLVHRLVANAFIHNPESKPYINHIDNDPTNNHVANLEWVTHSENMLHSQRQGRLLTSQRLGGRNGGIATLRSKKVTEELIGSTQACWYVDSLAEVRNRKQYFNVFCISCGTAYLRDKSYIKTSTQSNCIKCKTR